MKESCWDDCLEECSAVKIHPDLAKSRSLMETARGRVEYLEEVSVKEKNANYLFESYYASVVEMLHAFMVQEGFKVSNHICLGFYIKDVLRKDEMFRLFDDVRYKRNSLNYYGIKMDFETAKQAIDKCKALLEKIEKRL